MPNQIIRFGCIFRNNTRIIHSLLSTLIKIIHLYSAANSQYYCPYVKLMNTLTNVLSVVTTSARFYSVTFVPRMIKFVDFVPKLDRIKCFIWAGIH